MTSVLCLGADAGVLRETFRIAANLAVVSMHDPYAEGAPARNFTAGFSAQAGVSAALAGAAGLQGSQAAIEAVYDPFESILDDGFAAEFATLGEEWAIARNYFKPYPSCRYTHPPLDALRRALDGNGREDVGPGDVERITVHTFANATDMDHDSPRTMTGAKFSAPYVLARYVHDGTVDLDAFTGDAITEEPVIDLAQRVTLVEDDGYEAAFPESWGAQAEVRVTDGTELTGTCEYPRGDHRDPLSPDTVRERNRRLLAHGLPADRVDPALEALETLDRTPVRTTTAHLTRESD